MSDSFIFYVVRNEDGEFFRTRSNYGRWVAAINDAKKFSKLSQARSCVTWNADGAAMLLQIVEFCVSYHSGRVLDEAARVARVQAKRLTAAAERDRRIAKGKLENAQKDLARALAEIDRIRGGK